MLRYDKSAELGIQGPPIKPKKPEPPVAPNTNQGFYTSLFIPWPQGSKAALYNTSRRQQGACPYPKINPSGR